MERKDVGIEATDMMGCRNKADSEKEKKVDPASRREKARNVYVGLSLSRALPDGQLETSHNAIIAWARQGVPRGHVCLRLFAQWRDSQPLPKLSQAECESVCVARF